MSLLPIYKASSNSCSHFLKKEIESLLFGYSKQKVTSISCKNQASNPLLHKYNT